MAESCGEPYDSSDEYDRDERIETIYQGWGAREMAERIVDLEDEIGADVDGICTGMHADVAEAHAAWEDIRDERDRYRSAWRSARRRAFLTGLRLELAEQSRERRTAWLVRAVEHAGTHRRHRDRYRLAWLSARRRAADEANFGMEALALRDEVIRAQVDEMTRLRAFVDEVTEVRGWCMAGDTYRSHLTPIYESLHELEESQRERRTFRSRWTRTGHEAMHDQCPNHDTIESAVPQLAPCTCDNEAATVAYWKSELQRVHEEQSRETTDAPRLECVGTEEDGGTVWQLVDGTRIR
jgi:hypothetical protein